MDGLGENIRKILLAGVGAVATTAEKSKDILDDLVKKGELTVEQGKVLNEELKHTVKKTVKENVTVKVKPSNAEELESVLGDMTAEQIASLKEKLQKLEEAKAAEEADVTVEQAREAACEEAEAAPESAEELEKAEITAEAEAAMEDSIKEEAEKVNE